MIHTITPNAALDVTYTLPSIALGETNRVDCVSERPGGKGVNVARVLASLGHRTVATGFLGGDVGRHLRDLLSGSAVEQRWVEVVGTTRRTITVSDSHGQATAFNEPGPGVDADAWTRLTEQVLQDVQPDDVVVVSGSMPPGTTGMELAAFIGAVRGQQVRVVADTSGDALLAAAEAGSDLLKPNAEELYDVTGTADPIAGATFLLERGAGTVVVSMGEDGMLAVARSGSHLHGWRAYPGSTLSGNPTGAGDAAVAALAIGLHRSRNRSVFVDRLPEHLREAVALAGSAVLARVAGEVDLEAYPRLSDDVTIEEIHAARQA